MRGSWPLAGRPSPTNRPRSVTTKGLPRLPLTSHLRRDSQLRKRNPGEIRRLSPPAAVGWLTDTADTLAQTSTYGRVSLSICPYSFQAPCCSDKRHVM